MRIDIFFILGVLILLAIQYNANAGLVEYKRGKKVYWVYDDIKDESHKPKDAEKMREYQTAKALGRVKTKELSPVDYHKNPLNMRRRKLKQKLNNKGLNLKEINEYLRLM